MTTVRIVGGGSETELTLEGPVEIGRMGTDVEIADEELSRRHLRLTPGDDGTVVLEDLESSNGTWVDGARISGARTLEATTVVLAGQSRITVEIAVAEAAADGRTVFQTTPPELPDDGTKVSQTIPEAATKLHAEPAPEPQIESPTVVSTPDPVAAAAPPPPPAAAAPPPPPPPAPPPPPPPPPAAAAPPPPPPPAAAAPPPPPPPPAAAAPPPPPPAPPAPPPAPAPAPARSAAPAAAPSAGGLAAFGAYRPASRERRTGVASRQLAPAALVFLIIAATAAALVIYFASR